MFAEWTVNFTLFFLNKTIKFMQLYFRVVQTKQVIFCNIKYNVLTALSAILKCTKAKTPFSLIIFVPLNLLMSCDAKSSKQIYKHFINTIKTKYDKRKHRNALQLFKKLVIICNINNLGTFLEFRILIAQY